MCFWLVGTTGLDGHCNLGVQCRISCAGRGRQRGRLSFRPHDEGSLRRFVLLCEPRRLALEAVEQGTAGVSALSWPCIHRERRGRSLLPGGQQRGRRSEHPLLVVLGPHRLERIWQLSTRSVGGGGPTSPPAAGRRPQTLF